MTQCNLSSVPGLLTSYLLSTDRKLFSCNWLEGWLSWLILLPWPQGAQILVYNNSRDFQQLYFCMQLAFKSVIIANHITPPMNGPHQKLQGQNGTKKLTLFQVRNRLLLLTSFKHQLFPIFELQLKHWLFSGLPSVSFWTGITWSAFLAHWPSASPSDEATCWLIQKIFGLAMLFKRR